MNEDLSKLDLVGLLALLEPAPEPPPVSLWPQTAGWLWVAVLVVVAAAWLIHHWVGRHKANAYRRAALVALRQAGDDPVAIASVLRRTALGAFPRGEVAALHGDDWLAWLDARYGGTGFSDGPGSAFALAPYTRAQPSPELVPLVAEWIRRHRSDRR